MQFREDIFPLIKKVVSTHPVSNLLFISKIVERIIGYKKDNFTEYLLLKIVINLLLSSDDNMPSIVLLLDLSAALDTVDHLKLLDIVYYDMGITGTAYKWFELFLTNRTFMSKSVILKQCCCMVSLRVLSHTKPWYKYVKLIKFAN